MAHTFYSPEQAARSTLAALRYLSVLPRTVRQDFSSEFVAGRGRTIDVKKPVTVGAARDYTDANRTARDAIVFDDLSEATVPVTMDKQVYSAVRLPDDFATFTLTSLEQQVLRPQAEVVAEGIVQPLVDDMNGVAAAITAVPRTGADVIKAIIEARANLNARKVPMLGRTLAVGVEVEQYLLELDQLQKVNESGSDGLLREATIGRLFGFQIIVDPNLTADEGIAYTVDAFAHVTRPSRAPEGAAKTATVSQDGFALRWIQHYNPLQLEDQSVVDTFVGSTVLDADRAEKFKLAAAV